MYTNEYKAMLIAATQVSDLLEQRLPELKHIGLPTWLLLRTLASDGAMTISQLAAQRGVSRQSVHKQAATLIKQGWIVSDLHPTDKRCKLLKLTNEGLDRVARLESAIDKQAIALARMVKDEDIEMALEPMLLIASVLRQSCK
ncbi:MarR family winged helix-turn-helix transcriptional regulator [Salinibius halmophilus]|uniref:MarR family winged helix-turn-helix transcriptional regulator n=1 Tax=Salinibius halmophilus TaxID=1853216 RepID=UPI000E662195|nr:MarR family transcriptional regulator [Salinibius halmophilus]